MPCLRETAKRGFTLLELLVVVIIIGIIAGAAIPSFGRAAERSRVRDAQAILAAIFSAERIYRLDENTFGAAAALWTNNHYLTDPNVQNADWAFTVALTGAGAGFTATATRQGGSFNGNTVWITDAFDGNNYDGNHPLRTQ